MKVALQPARSTSPAHRHGTPLPSEKPPAPTRTPLPRRQPLRLTCRNPKRNYAPVTTPGSNTATSSEAKPTGHRNGTRVEQRREAEGGAVGIGGGGRQSGVRSGSRSEGCQDGVPEMGFRKRQALQNARRRTLQFLIRALSSCSQGFSISLGSAFLMPIPMRDRQTRFSFLESRARSYSASPFRLVPLGSAQGIVCPPF